MRINRFIAQASGLSRRAADTAIENGRVMVGGQRPSPGYDVQPADVVTLDGQPLTASRTTTIMLNKPVGYVCSREGQGSKTVYELLPPELHHLKPVGRLDKDSSGLLLLTNDGQLAQTLTHPKFEKLKKYKIALNKDLTEADFERITKTGVQLEDGLSQFALDSINTQHKEWKVAMREGRNRQIRRTFEHLGYSVVKLHRTHFGAWQLDNLSIGHWQEAKTVL